MSKTRGEDITDYFLQHPVSQSVTINSTFTLACRIRVSLFQVATSGSQKPTVQWVRNKFGLGTTREDIQEAGMEANSLTSRYDLPYNLDEGKSHVLLLKIIYFKTSSHTLVED